MGTRTPGRDIEKYTEVNSEVSDVYQCKKDVREFLLSRENEISELKRLRASYLKPRWAAANTKFDEFVLRVLQKVLDGAYSEGMWPYQGEFEVWTKFFLFTSHGCAIGSRSKCILSQKEALVPLSLRDNSNATAICDGRLSNRQSEKETAGKS